MFEKSQLSAVDLQVQLLFNNAIQKIKNLWPPVYFFYNCHLQYMNVSKRLRGCFGKFWLNLFHPEWSVRWQLHWKSRLLHCLHKPTNNSNTAECSFMVDTIKLVWWEKLIKLLGAQTWKLGERFEHLKVWLDVLSS